jgi:hypothetical protein
MHHLIQQQKISARFLRRVILSLKEKTAIISLNTINQLILVMEISVFAAEWYELIY